MSRYEHGRILAVNETTLGSELVGDHAAGVSSLTVEDAVDFDEDGGWLKIADQVVEYSTYDDDTGEITLKSGYSLTAAAVEGDRVDVWDELRQVVTVDKIAQVELDGDDDNTDPLEAIIPLHLLDDLAEGIRGVRGESVLLEQDGDEWRVVDVSGLAAAGASGQQWEADDVYVLTAADVTAGVATCPLSHRPVDESVAAVAGGVPQEPTGYTIDYLARTVTWPLSGFEQAGDKMWFHYTYQSGVATSSSVIGWGSEGWSYLQVAATDTADYSSVGFDDSAWTVGDAPFGNNTPVPVPIPPATIWDAGTSLWIRRTLPPAFACHVEVLIEDNCTVYFNGVEVGSAVNGDTGKVETILRIEVPNNLVNRSAENMLAIRCNDEEPPNNPSTVYADFHVVMEK